MASVVERREHSRRSRSPPRGRERRVSPPRRRSSPARRTGSPARARSPVKASLRERSSPPREKAKEQARSPKHARKQSRSQSPARRRDSRSPSPRTKRLRRTQGEREVSEADRGKAAHREERNSGRHREHDEERDALRDRKGVREVAQVTDSDRRKASHKEERDSGRHREHDDRRDAVRDRKAEREGVQVNECGDRRKASHKEGDSGRHREHHVEGSDLSRDRKVEWVDSRGAAKDGKSDCDDGRDHSRDRKAGRDERSSASREALLSREDERYDSRGGRSDREDRKAASSREQRVDCSDRRDSTRGRMTDWEESNGGSGRSSRHGRSLSPEEHRHRGRHESHSSPRASRSTISHAEDVNSRGDEVSRGGDADSVAMMKAAAEALEAKEKQKPSFELSGKLAEETNRVAGVNLLYSEPPEARKSDIRWRLYVFKGGEPLPDPLYVHRMTCYLFGRERKVADVPTDHPSCSKQHAVLQYRLVEKEQPDGMMAKKVRPYLMDLDSTNGTFVNDNRIEPRRYYELFEKDTIKFGNSSREYVLLHENSAE